MLNQNIMMRKLLIIPGLVFVLASCTKNFATLNQNPSQPTSVPLVYLFSSAQLEMGGSQNDPGYTQWRTNLFYCATMTQQMASTNTNQYVGDKYIYADEPSGAWFGFSSSGEGQYLNALKTMTQLLYSAKKDSADNSNLIAMTEILRVYLFQQITDIYGDVPYFDAGNGYITQNTTPNYDKQQAIYLDMLNQLSVAGASLSASASNPGSADFAYSGNITYWQHFANSLMLRLALRIVNADPTDAQTWGTKAITGGLLASNAENFQFNWSGGPSSSCNPNSYDLGASNSAHRGEVGYSLTGGVGDIQWGATLINMMKARKDPRLGMIATIPGTGPVVFSSTGVVLGDTAAADQNGLPNGLTEGASLQAATGFLSSKGCCFSVPTPYIYQDNSPQILLSYAESEFMLAEAIDRGWASGSAATEFQKGQAASLQTILSYNNSANGSPFTISAAAIANYQAANPFPGSGLAADLPAIQAEMYVLTAVTINFIEEWADWRRTGFPALTPVNYPGNAGNGQIPRRLVYPQEESVLDPAGYQSAITDQGPDLFTTHVWWDK
jgi:hypothetical protein